MRKRRHPESAIAGGDEDDGSCDCLAALERDIRIFMETSKLPDGLAEHVKVNKGRQVEWFEEMSNAWRDLKTPLQTPEDGTKFVYNMFRKITPYAIEVFKLEDLLKFYGLPYSFQVELPQPDDDAPLDTYEPRRFLLVLETLPLTWDQVTDEGGFTIFVEVKHYFYLPSELLFLITEHRKACRKGDKSRAHELLNQINATQDYKIVEIDKMELLTKKYQIRLRGIDGIEARDELLKMVNGKCLKIDVYYIDDNGCCVGDVYCDGIFLQEKLLEKGFKVHPDPVLAELKIDACPCMGLEEDVVGMELC